MGAPGAAPAASAPNDLGALLQRELGGEITLKDPVRTDGFTTVYAGTETRQGRPVLVHVVPPEVAAAHHERAQRLLRAARTTAKLRHPRVASILRVSAGDRLCWYVTGPETGESLTSLLAREGTLAPDRAADVLVQAAAALACAHEHKVVHGDLTPDAIVVERDGSVTVRGFGFAGATTDAAAYRAPELDLPAGGAESLSTLTGMSAAADQYALGIIAWQMLAGTLPFQGDDAALRLQHRTAPLPPLAMLRPGLPAAVGTVLERATAKRPADRFPGVGKFAQALRAAVDGRTSQPARPALRPSGGALLIGPEAPGAIASLPAPVRARTVRRPVILGALGGATALALVALLAWRSSDDTLSIAERQRLEAAARAMEAPEPVADPSILSRPIPRSAPADPIEAGPSDAATVPPPAPAAARPRPHDTRPARDTRKRPEAAAPVRSGTAWISIGTNPQAAIFINQTPAPTNPVVNWPVQAGQVFLRFEVLDPSSGVWTRDMVVTVAPGDTLNLRRIRLTRP